MTQVSAAEALQLQKKNTFVEKVEQSKNKFLTMYGDKGAKIFEREKVYANMAVQKNPELLNCNPISIYTAVTQVAMIDMSLDPVKGLCHLVPRKGVCTLVVDYKGLIDLMYRELQILITLGVVYEGDEGAHDFKEGAGGYVNAKRTFNRSKDAKKLYFYSVAQLPDGRTHCHIMDYNEVLQRKAVATTKAVWDKWEDDMGKKTVLRSHNKFLPKSPRIDAAMEVIDQELGLKTFKEQEQDSLLPDGMNDDEHAEAVVVETQDAKVLSVETPNVETTVVQATVVEQPKENQPKAKQEPIIVQSEQSLDPSKI
jgi:phage RecT family recombinase